MIFKVPEPFNLYLNDFLIWISLIFFSYLHVILLFSWTKNAQTRLVTSNLSISLSQVWIVQTRKPNLHPLTTLFLPYTICPTSGWKIIIFKWVVKSYFGWMKSFRFFNSGWKFPPKIQKKQQWLFQSLLLKMSVSYRNRTYNRVLGELQPIVTLCQSEVR